MLRLTPHAQRGFVLTDFPRDIAEAEVLETYRNGISAFVHLSLPDEILVDLEENKHVCGDCNKEYQAELIVDQEQGIRIESFLPEDGHCSDCGSTNINHGSDPIQFEKDLTTYKDTKENLLQFYDHYVSYPHFLLYNKLSIL